MGIFDTIFGNPNEKNKKEINQMVVSNFQNEFDDFLKWSLKFQIESVVTMQTFSSTINQKWFMQKFCNSYCFRFYQLGFTFPDTSSKMQARRDWEMFLEEMNSILDEVKLKILADSKDLGEEKANELAKLFKDILLHFNSKGEELGNQYPMWEIKQKRW